MHAYVSTMIISDEQYLLSTAFMESPCFLEKSMIDYGAAASPDGPEETFNPGEKLGLF